MGHVFFSRPVGYQEPKAYSHWQSWTQHLIFGSAAGSGVMSMEIRQVLRLERKAAIGTAGIGVSRRFAAAGRLEDGAPGCGFAAFTSGPCPVAAPAPPIRSLGRRGGAPSPTLFPTPYLRSLRSFADRILQSTSSPSMTPSKIRAPSCTSTSMRSPGPKRPERISWARGFSSCARIARLSGLAP